jgi:hypothetical protein
MRKLIYAGAITLAIFGSIGFAAAQRGPGADHPILTPTQERTVSQGLAASPSQAAPVGVRPQVGNMLPDSLAAQELPSDVSDRVPEARQLLFVKLPDRIVLINPETKLVTEIVMDEVTTGSNPGSSDRPSGSRRSRPDKGVDEYAVRSFGARARPNGRSCLRA